LAEIVKIFESQSKVSKNDSVMLQNQFEVSLLLLISLQTLLKNLSSNFNELVKQE